MECFKNKSFYIHSLSCLSNNHLRDSFVRASQVMTGLFIEPDFNTHRREKHVSLCLFLMLGICPEAPQIKAFAIS